MPAHPGGGSGGTFLFRAFQMPALCGVGTNNGIASGATELLEIVLVDNDTAPSEIDLTIVEVTLPNGQATSQITTLIRLGRLLRAMR